MPTSKTTASHIASLILDNWPILYGIPEYGLTDIGPQLISRFLKFLCAILGTEHLTTTVYHLQTSERFERFNEMIITRLQPYVDEYQTDWDINLPQLKYA